MAKEMMNSKDPGIIASEKALRRAAHRALELGLRTGTPADSTRQDAQHQPNRYADVEERFCPAIPARAVQRTLAYAGRAMCRSSRLR